MSDLVSLKLHEPRMTERGTKLLSPPFLAYLSACSTGSNKVEGLEDENLHLMTACQLAEFRHVIGTLWPVSDEHCVDVAKTVFSRVRAGLEAPPRRDSVKTDTEQSKEEEDVVDTAPLHIGVQDTFMSQTRKANIVYGGRWKGKEKATTAVEGNDDAWEDDNEDVCSLFGIG
ncbi:hypothetical protein QBC38DRAFT_453782 [Podospora fimiseda]|uniref:CHAT domain-containing protein n=1 Tax=Podospora fimiseda TaxID=252190 RepID=A0AAN7BT73_9PEZI|nr:hypothetical protein QBC38DRAFT_453782 [Podospora fimiseda]